MTVVANLNDIRQGDTKRYKNTFTDANNVAIDITGYTLWLTLKVNQDDADVDAVLQVSSLAGSHALDNVPGGIQYIELTSTDTMAVTPGTYHFDIQRVIPGSPPDVTTLRQGKVKIKYGITNTIT